jgi:hypothetical protein
LLFASLPLNLNEFEYWDSVLILKEHYDTWIKVIGNSAMFSFTCLSNIIVEVLRKPIQISSVLAWALSRPSIGI